MSVLPRPLKPVQVEVPLAVLLLLLLLALVLLCSLVLALWLSVLVFWLLSFKVLKVECRWRGKVEIKQWFPVGCTKTASFFLTNAQREGCSIIFHSSREDLHFFGESYHFFFLSYLTMAVHLATHAVNSSSLSFQSVLSRSAAEQAFSTQVASIASTWSASSS